MSSGTFAAFSKFHINTSKIYQYESCPVGPGTQLSCRMAFPSLRGKGWKSWSTTSTSCSLSQVGIQTLAAIYTKTVEKNTIEPL
jgi:hypothetical protein